jgi:hypothetical protein
VLKFDWLTRTIRFFRAHVNTHTDQFSNQESVLFDSIFSGVIYYLSNIEVLKMDQIQQFTEPCKQFMKDSIRLVKKCTKPDRKGN